MGRHFCRIGNRVLYIRAALRTSKRSWLRRMEPRPPPRVRHYHHRHRGNQENLFEETTPLATRADSHRTS